MADVPWNISYGLEVGTGRLQTYTYPDGNVIKYTFDDTNNYVRITGVQLNSATIANVNYDTTQG